jgi:hypothetical protein
MTEPDRVAPNPTLQSAGLLDDILGGDLPDYKRAVGIPESNCNIITAAFRAALYAIPSRLPLHLNIIAGSAETATVTSTATEVVVVTRDEIQKE